MEQQAKARVIRPKRTAVPSNPPPVKTVINTIEQTLTTIDLGDGRHLTPEQIKSLSSLEFLDKTRILSQEQYYVIINVISLLQRFPFDQVIDYLRTTPDIKSFYQELPSLAPEREQVRLQTDSLQRTTEAEEGLHTCSDCHQKKTLSRHKQVRSADEPMSEFVRCLNCGKRWRID